MMNIEVVTIGNEILTGFTVNTNAADIGRELFQAGFRVTRQTTLSDDYSVLKQGLSESLQRNDIVITTGGLGPTCDDITRNVVAELFGSDFRYDEEIAADLKKRYGDHLISLQDQARVPTKALLLKNPVGTASGLIFKSETSSIILMPGVPHEMKVMLSEQLVPYLNAQFSDRKNHYMKSLNIFRLPESAVDPVLRQLQKEHPDVEFGIYPSQGVLSVHLSVAAANAASAEAILAPPFASLAKQFASRSFEAPSGKIEEAVHQMFIDKKITLSIAESCTGGSVAARLTRIPGASKYFLGSIVAYSNALKTELLGVPHHLILEKGAVSGEVASQMATGILSVTKSDFAIAVTGIAGPSGGSPEKPVGTIWGAAARQNQKPRVWKFQTFGNREMVINQSVNGLLGELLLLVRS
jgi:nicotinamide-nucleotide amidase